jgi:hypothetical protein
MILRKIKIILCIYLPYLNFYRNINIYSATVPDRMHHLDLGLFRYQIEYTYELLKSQHNNIIVNELDRRLSVIPHYTGLKIFSNGIQSIARMTANEYRSLMKVMLFVVDNLYSENDRIDVSNNDLAKLYECWNKMYLLSRYEEFSESDLVKFKVSTQILYSSRNIKIKTYQINILLNFRMQYMNGSEGLFKFSNLSLSPN